MPMTSSGSVFFPANHRAIMSVFPSRPVRLLLVISGVLLAGYWLTLLVMTHLPPDFLYSHFTATGEYLEQGGDKPLHLLAYSGLAFLFTSWLWFRGVEEPRLWKLTAVVLCSYAVFDELSQIPFRRTADVADCLADWAGIALGSLCFLAARMILDRFSNRRNATSFEAR